MKKLILFILLIPLFIYAQEVPDKCDKEIEIKCDPNIAIYDCIIDGLKSNKNYFSKECTPKIIAKMKDGKYPDPCLVEQQKLCPPGSAQDCILINRNSLTTGCQEKITEDGAPKIPDQEEMKKVQKSCEGLLMVECGHIEIDMEIAFRDGRASQGNNLMKKYQSCMKQALANPKDDKCREMMKEYADSQVKK
ncbi:MAG: hypothetical protein DRQ88_00275 [Epsilonproteobacteria bacterium]|nr:MAG: hypothetical protein DRQ89_06200 [Campylobacterota bacterium]RLA68071.1 MAG: hypothetical protein DRQ88_00275 [Campylobacterota bacterium]